MINNFEEGTIAMERKRIFPLTKDKYSLWEQFVTNNYETIYSNKDTHEVLHTPNSPHYVVSVLRTEQSGMQEFLEKFLAIQDEVWYTVWTQRYDLDIKGNFLESLSSYALYLHPSRYCLIQFTEVMGQLAHSPNSKELAMILKIL